MIKIQTISNPRVVSTDTTNKQGYMNTFKGRYENGRLILYSQPEDLPAEGRIVLTFLPSDQTDTASEEEDLSLENPEEEHDEQYYAQIRQHTRKKARGKITIVDDLERSSYQLNDYSEGGLSFLADDGFDKSGIVHAGIVDPTDPDMILMELEMEIRGIYDTDGGKKVGCQFQDSLDEDLWHGLVQYLG